VGSMPTVCVEQPARIRRRVNRNERGFLEINIGVS
jgi:hypothetical protein